jgi:chemotaxis signal transduction protein
MAALFNLPFQANPYAPVIILRRGQDNLGLLVSQVESVIALDDLELHPLAAGHVANEYAEAEFSIKDRSVVLIDCGRLLLAEEQRRIAEMQATVEQRLRALEIVEP